MDDQERHYQAKLAYEIDPSDLAAALAHGETITIVDTRTPESYAREHIPGAINIPHRNMSASTTAGLDKNATVVTYCDGIGCNGSTKGALNMLRLGFRVKELIGGMEWWLRDGYVVDGSAATTTNSGSCGCS
jgi:rhodanese-related sulfurtransferase